MFGFVFGLEVSSSSMLPFSGCARFEPLDASAVVSAVVTLVGMKLPFLS